MAECIGENYETFHEARESSLNNMKHFHVKKRLDPFGDKSICYTNTPRKSDTQRKSLSSNEQNA